MYYKTASFKVNNYYKKNNYRIYRTNIRRIDISLLIIKLLILTSICVLIIGANFLILSLYNKYSRQLSEKKENYNQLLNEYDSLNNEKNNLFTQKNFNDYAKKLGLYPPNENQIIRLKD